MSAPNEQLAAEILAQFTDAASVHFDHSLAQMPLDDAQQRELRYWQRQSLAVLREFAAAALPGALDAVTAARRDAMDSLAAAVRTWDERGATAAPPTSTGVAPDPAGAPAPADAATGQPAATNADLLEVRRRSVAARLASGA